MRKLALTLLSIVLFAFVFLIAEFSVRLIRPTQLRQSHLKISSIAVPESINSPLLVRREFKAKFEHDYHCDYDGVSHKKSSKEGAKVLIRQGPNRNEWIPTTIIENQLNYKGQRLLTWTSTEFPNEQRLTPDHRSGSDLKHLVFWGCSFTYGATVNDNETLPFFVQENSPGNRAYNLARQGGSAADSIAYMEKDPSLSFLAQREGVGIFVFIGAHLARMAGSYSLLNHYLSDFHHIEREADGHFHSRGPWRESRPILVHWIQLLYKSEFFRWINLDLYVRSGRIVPDFVRDYADALRDLKEKYLSGTLRTNRFVVLLYPDSYGALQFAINPLKEELLKRDIEVFDYSNGSYSEISEFPSATPADCHPNAEAHRLIGKWLSEDLDLKN